MVKPEWEKYLEDPEISQEVVKYLKTERDLVALSHKPRTTEVVDATLKLEKRLLNQEANIEKYGINLEESAKQQVRDFSWNIAYIALFISGLYFLVSGYLGN